MDRLLTGFYRTRADAWARPCRALPSRAMIAPSWPPWRTRVAAGGLRGRRHRREPRPDRSLASCARGRTRTVAAGAGRRRQSGVRRRRAVALDFGPERVELRLSGRPLPHRPPRRRGMPRRRLADHGRSDVERRSARRSRGSCGDDGRARSRPGRGDGPSACLGDRGRRARSAFDGDVLQACNDVPATASRTLASLWPRFQTATRSGGRPARRPAASLTLAADQLRRACAHARVSRSPPRRASRQEPRSGRAAGGLVDLQPQHPLPDRHVAHLVHQDERRGEQVVLACGSG